jgi:oligoendopeptidase F
MNTFQQLNEDEKVLLLKAPAYISLLAANADGEIDDTEKKAAIDLVHVKTYSSKPLLRDYYIEVEKMLIDSVESLDRQLPKGKEERKVAILDVFKKMESTFSKLDPLYAQALHESLESYKNHVSKAHRNVLASFIIPVYIKGISDL